MEINDDFVPLRIEQSPDGLEEWYINNRLTISKAILHNSLFMKETGWREVEFMYFEDKGRTYCTMSLERELVSGSLDSAINDFIENEEFEMAAVARDLITYFNNLNNEQTKNRTKGNQ